jgi:hypothetical protein
MSRALTIRQRRELADQAARDAVATRYKIPPNSDIMVADCSGSMYDIAFEGKTRYDCLKTAIQPFKGRVQVLAFNDYCTECAVDTIPHPSGGTRLSDALAKVATLEPLHVLVVSDGEPDSKERALTQADVIAPQAIIDVLYIGPPENERAIEFMKELARHGHGRYQAFDTKAFSPELLESGANRLLALPTPTKTIES